jgi:hypothetical protein
MMKTLKTAFITTIPTDAAPFISAAKTFNDRTGDVAIQYRLQNGGDFRDFGTLDSLIQYAKQCHVVIIHLMGDLPDFDHLMSSMKLAGVPVFVASSVKEKNAEYKQLSTVMAEDYLSFLGILIMVDKKTLKTCYTIWRIDFWVLTAHFWVLNRHSGTASTTQILTMFPPLLSTEKRNSSPTD